MVAAIYLSLRHGTDTIRFLFFSSLFISVGIFLEFENVHMLSRNVGCSDGYCFFLLFFLRAVVNFQLAQR